MKEIWKPVTGSVYYVSSIGRVRHSDIILCPWAASNGYQRIVITRHGQRRQYAVHRLVAEAFIPNPDGKQFVDHINTIKNDNRVENLRWVTAAENSNNPLTKDKLRAASMGARNAKTMSGKFGALCPVSRPVYQLSAKGAIIHEFECARAAMRATGIDCGSITKCCRGQRKTAGKFGWAYKHGKGDQ